MRKIIFNIKIVCTYLAFGFLSLSIFAAATPNKHIDRGTATAMVLSGPFGLIASSFYFILNDKVCVLNCGDK